MFWDYMGQCIDKCGRFDKIEVCKITALWVPVLISQPNEGQAEISYDWRNIKMNCICKDDDQCHP